jgi:hypothetical protein
MSSTKLINILQDTLKESNFFPLYFRNGGINLTGEAAWNKWIQWANLNRKDEFLYKVLNTIKKQGFMTSPKQMEVLIKWFNKKR